MSTATRHSRSILAGLMLFLLLARALAPSHTLAGPLPAGLCGDDPALVACWPADDGSGSTLSDVGQAPANDATLYRAPAWVAGHDGLWALGLNGTSQYGLVADDDSLDIQNSITLAAWVKPSKAGTQNLVKKAINSNTDGYELSLASPTSPAGQKFFVRFNQTTGGDAYRLNSTSNYPADGATWAHVAATYDGTTMRLYVNGVLDNSLTPTTPCTIATNALPLGLGSDSEGGNKFQGAMDDVLIYNRALSAAEIAPLARYAPQTLAPDPDMPGYTPQATAAPSDLTAVTAPGSQIDLSWVDHATDETGFEVEFAAASDCSTVTTWNALGSTGANVTALRHWDTAANTSYCYRVRATGSAGPSEWSASAGASTPASYSALSLGRDRAYVPMTTDQSAVGLKWFTVETWFRREGPGVPNTTGTGGIEQAIPLVAKGAAQEEGTTADINYILAVDDATDVLAADMEECDPADSTECPAGGTAGLNHPLRGVTPIELNTWYHAAVTYDGGTWRLYLNGNLERELTAGRLPRWDNASPLGLGTSMRTNGTAQGFFDGSLDEVRIWNTARTQEQIRETINAQITEATSGLVARWSLDEGLGTSVAGSAGTSIGGSIYPSGTATGWNWTADAPFNVTFSPDAPVLVSPADNGVGGSTTHLEVTVSDRDSDSLTVSFYGRPYCDSEPFTVIALPDTQYYSESYPSIFQTQTAWVQANQAGRNIAFVTHLGDIVDQAEVPQQWTNADAAMDLLDSASGLPYGLVVGNHDSYPYATPESTTAFNSTFGAARFEGQPYYCGHYGSDNDNSCQYFTASGMEFIVLHLEYDNTPGDANGQAVLQWADGVLKDNASRRAIVATHDLLTGNSSPAAFSTQGQAIYDALKDNPNLFLMLGGHADTEVMRSDTYGGHTVYSLRSDYQTRSNGGNGWLRLMEFDPATDTIHVRTYSPYLEQWETDANSQFDLVYDMAGTACQPFEVIGTVQVASGATAGIDWAGLDDNGSYQWYVAVSDGTHTTTGPTWSFRVPRPTAVTLESLEAQPIPAGIRITWRVSSELDTAGYRLWRSASPDAGYELLQVDVIPVHPGGLMPADYMYEDTDVTAGQRYYYRLEEQETDGDSTFYGPVSAVAGMPYRILIPMARR